MWTSAGRYFSKAAFSGAFAEVWPATIVDSLVAGGVKAVWRVIKEGDETRTWAVLRHDTINKLCLDTVDNEIGRAGDCMAVWKHGDAGYVCQCSVQGQGGSCGEREEMIGCA